MKPVEKLFHLNSLFPFHITYKDTKAVEVELPYHFHEWYEIVYVYRGEGKIFINQTIYNMKKGDIFLIPGNTLHHSIPNRDNPVTSTAIFFNPILISNRISGDGFDFLHVFDKASRFNLFKSKLNSQQQDMIVDMIEMMITELNSEKLGYKSGVLVELQRLLLYLARMTNDEEAFHKNFNEFSGPSWLQEVLTHIEENYTRDISLQSLSALGNVSTAHLSRVFKQVTGLNIVKYIIQKRIIKAKELLLNTEDKISSVALQCGFDSLPHFYRTFKEAVGATPTDFRNKT